MQLSQTMKLKEIELIIQVAFKFCMVLQINRIENTNKKTYTEKIILVYRGTITGKYFSHFYYLV